MYKCKMEAYEGKEPYIFVSYAHKDSDEVLPLLDALAEKGCRIWYDNGIAPGSEWPEYIATHLDRSAMVLAFISPNSIASANCRREVTFSLSRQKLFIGIYLQETELSPGMEMQLSSQQCIMKYRYPTLEEFCRKLLSSDVLLPCITPAAAEMPESVCAVSTDTIVPKISAADMEAVNNMKAAAEDRKSRRTKKTPRSISPGKSKRKGP